MIRLSVALTVESSPPNSGGNICEKVTRDMIIKKYISGTFRVSLSYHYLVIRYLNIPGRILHIATTALRVFSKP